MSMDERTLKSSHKLGQPKKDFVSQKLKLPQLVAIIVLIFLNTQILQYLPLQIGPLTQSMLMELIAVALVLPWIFTYARNLDNRDKYLFLVGSCMFFLGLINLTGIKGVSQQRIIFISFYAYFFIVCFFSGHPEFGGWLRRLHLFPALAIIYMIGSAVFSPSGWIDFESRIGGNETASYLAFILPICWVQFQRERGLFQLLNLFIIGASPLAILVTASRTALVVFIVVAILMIIAEKAAKRAIILVVFFLLLLSLFFLLPKQSVFRTRISSLQDPVGALKVDRIALWKAAILSIKEHPLFGGNFRSNVQRLVLEAAPDSNYARHITYDIAGGNFGVHNGFLAVMVDFGIPVALLYFGFFISLGKALFHSGKRIQNRANRSLLFAGLTSLIGYAVANITLHIYVGQEYFVLWAMLQSSIKNSLLEEETEV